MEETTDSELEVQGNIPPDLNGLYLRNGPNPKSGESDHWFLGDGMVHGVAIKDGQALWYRNRWVRTEPYLHNDSRGLSIDPLGTVDRHFGKANTNVIYHGKKILALVESSFPTELSNTLDTIGTWNFDNKLSTAMTAHPKICPVTGEMHFFGYDFKPPYLTYHSADANGQLVHSNVIDVPGPTMMHDFAITETDVIFMDLPVVFRMDRALSGGLPYAWSDDYGARIGIMKRRDPNKNVQWFDVDPCYVFHPLNAYNEGSKAVLDVARYPEIWRDNSLSFESASLYRFVFDPADQTVTETRVDSRPIEFPRVDARREGLPNRFGYAVLANNATQDLGFTALIQYDLEQDTAIEHNFGPGRSPGEGVFVPNSVDAAENEGWVLSLVYDRSRDSSFLAILDAQDFEATPVAAIMLPKRVPFGFHGNWISEQSF